MLGLNRTSREKQAAQVAEWRRRLVANRCVLERVDHIGRGLLDRRFKDVGALFLCEEYYALNAGVEKGRHLIEMWRKPGLQKP